MWPNSIFVFMLNHGFRLETIILPPPSTGSKPPPCTQDGASTRAGNAREATELGLPHGRGGHLPARAEKGRNASLRGADLLAGHGILIFFNQLCFRQTSHTVQTGKKKMDFNRFYFAV